MERVSDSKVEIITRWIPIAVFLLILSLPMIGHLGGLFDQSYIAATEKRSPNPMPESLLFRKDPKAYALALESYINDHFGFREKLVRLNSRVRLWLGVSSSDKVVIGKKGWLYYSSENIIEQYRGIDNFSLPEMDSWIDAAESRKKWLSERGIKYIFAFFPEKTSVYPEYLPDWATRVSPTRREQIKKRLEESDVDYVDVTPAVLEAKKHNPVYYKTDSHWNFHGGFAGYTALMELVRKHFPSVKPISSEDLEFGYKTTSNQDLAQILNLTGSLKDPNSDYYKLRKPSRVLSVESLDKKNRLPFIVKTDIADAPRVIVMRDSYSDLIEPYLNETFREILYLSHGDQTLDTKLIEAFKPDLVISAMVERILIYPFHGLVPKDSPYILDWGPKIIVPGERFNVQAGGKSAMWVKVANINSSCEIIWAGKKLDSYVNAETGVIAADVPDELFQAEGSFSINVADIKNGKTSQRVPISIKNQTGGNR